MGAVTFAEIVKDYSPGTRVRVKPDTPSEQYVLRHGYSVRGTVVGIHPGLGDRVRVEWDNNHPGDRRPRHRETIALEHIEPL